jgi:hypothetical protein
VIDFKMPADTPRVIRSPFLPDDQTAYVMSGELFEDGRSRLLLRVALCEPLEEKIIAVLDEADHHRRTLDAVTTVAKIIAGGSTKAATDG